MKRLSSGATFLATPVPGQELTWSEEADAVPAPPLTNVVCQKMVAVERQADRGSRGQAGHEDVQVLRGDGGWQIGRHHRCGWIDTHGHELTKQHLKAGDGTLMELGSDVTTSFIFDGARSNCFVLVGTENQIDDSRGAAAW